MWLDEFLKIKQPPQQLFVTPPQVLQGFLFMSEDEQFTEKDYRDMIDMWICIEDKKEVIHAICEEEMEELETITKPAEIDNVNDDNELKFMEVNMMSLTFSHT